MTTRSNSNAYEKHPSTEHYSEFVEQLIASGRYKNASEVLRAGLRLLEQSTTEEQEKLALLRNLATEGFDQIDQG